MSELSATIVFLASAGLSGILAGVLLSRRGHDTAGWIFGLGGAVVLAATVGALVVGIVAGSASDAFRSGNPHPPVRHDVP